MAWNKENCDNRGIPMYTLDDMPEDKRGKLWTLLVAYSRENDSPNVQGINLPGFKEGWDAMHSDF